MNVQNVVELSRAGHQFIGLSADSIQKLEKLRQLFTLVPQLKNIADRHDASLISCDDDALVDAVYRAIATNCHHHTAFDTGFLLNAELSEAAVAANNIGRFVSSAAVRDEQSAMLPSSVADAPSRRDASTFGGMRVYDRPWRLPTLRCGLGEGPCIALLRNPLCDGASHRISMQILALPPIDETLMPACTVGITYPEVVGEGRSGEWIGICWRVGTSLPCAAHLIATLTTDQPYVQSSIGHVFIHVGDVVTLELRPRPKRELYERLITEQRKALDSPSAERINIDCLAYVNGMLIGELRGIERYQPIAPSDRYRAAYDTHSDPLSSAKHRPRGLHGCRFGVQLCKDACVALYGLSSQ